MFAGFLLTFGTTFANVLCFLIDFPHMLCFLNNSYQFTFLYCISIFLFLYFLKILTSRPDGYQTGCGAPAGSGWQFWTVRSRPYRRRSQRARRDIQNARYGAASELRISARGLTHKLVEHFDFRSLFEQVDFFVIRRSSSKFECLLPAGNTRGKNTHFLTELFYIYHVYNIFQFIVLTKFICTRNESFIHVNEISRP